MEFECERDGIVIRAGEPDELVAQVERHVAKDHPELVGKLLRRDILAAAKEV